MVEALKRDLWFRWSWSW